MSSTTTATASLPVPPEIVHEIIRHLSATSHCPSCLQTDLSALCSSSRVLNAIATPYLYTTVSLASSRDTTTESYPRRVRALQRTVSTTPLGGLIKHLQFLADDAATSEQWAKIVAHTPALQTLHGVDNFFSEDGEHSEDDEVAASALAGLGSLRKAVLHDEVLPVPLSQLLRAWGNAETLVLGSVIADGSSFRDLSAAPESLRNLFFHDFDLDFQLPQERDDALASLPPLEVLGIDYTLGFSLSGVARFLRQSQAHAARLREFEFLQQMRRHNFLAALVDVVNAATGLERMDVALTCHANDPAEPFPEGQLESKTLRELGYRAVYMSSSAAAGRSNDDFERLLISSVAQLPELRVVRVAHEVGRGRAASGEEEEEEDETLEMWRVLRAECARDGSVFTEDPALVGKDGKRVLVVVVDEEGGAVSAAERVSSMKRGGSGVGSACVVEKECEEVCEV